MKNARLTALALAVALIALAPARADPVGDGPLRIAVLPFEGDGLSAADARGLTLFFEAALQNTGLCELVEQTEVGRILKAHEFALSDFSDPDKAVAIGKLVPADTIAIGVAGTLGGKPYLNVKLIDLRTGTVVAARGVTAPDVAALAAELNALAAGVLGRPGSAAPERAPAPAAVPASDIPAVARYMLAAYESGPGVPPPEARIYASTFDTSNTRFINWDLVLEFAPPVARYMELPLIATIYRSNGSVLPVQTMTAYLQAGWTWFRTGNGWGSPYTYNWAPDAYLIQISLGSRAVAQVRFDVR